MVDVHPAVPILGCQNINAVLRYQNYVLELSTALLTLRHYRPAVVPVVNARVAAFRKHWLDGKARPGFQDEIMVIFEMENVRQHMNLRSNTMSSKLAYNPVIVRRCNIVDAAPLVNDRVRCC